MASFGYHYGFLAGKMFLLVLSLANRQELSSSLLLHAFEVNWSLFKVPIPPFFPHPSPTCCHLEIMLLPTISHVCPDHQTAVTQTKRHQRYVNVKLTAKICREGNKWQNVFSSGRTYPLSVQCKVFIKT